LGYQPNLNKSISNPLKDEIKLKPQKTPTAAPKKVYLL